MEHYNLSVDIDWIISADQHSVLIDYVSKKFIKCEKIIFIDCHHNILDFLIEEDVSLVNIDYHCDLINLPNFPMKHLINEGNWVNYLYLKNNLKDYIWINNVNSFISDSLIHDSQLRNLRTFKIEHDLNYIKNFEYKKIIICKSKDYHWENGYKEGVIAFDILKSIANNFFPQKVIIDNNLNPYKYLNK